MRYLSAHSILDIIALLAAVSGCASPPALGGASSGVVVEAPADAADQSSVVTADGDQHVSTADSMLIDNGGQTRVEDATADALSVDVVEIADDAIAVLDTAQTVSDSAKPTPCDDGDPCTVDTVLPDGSCELGFAVTTLTIDQMPAYAKKTAIPCELCRRH